MRFRKHGLRAGESQSALRRKTPWSRNPEGLEWLTKVAQAWSAAFPVGLTAALLGSLGQGSWAKLLGQLGLGAWVGPIAQLGLGQLVRLFGVVLIVLGTPGVVAALVLTIATAVAKRRTHKEALDREAEKQLWVPIKSLSEINPYDIGVDREALDLPLLPGDEDAYFPRDLDGKLREELDAALRRDESTLIVVLGPTKAGKSRTLFEALARHPQLAGATLIAPKHKDALDWLLRRGDCRRYQNRVP